jgi:hypothetical protein
VAGTALAVALLAGALAAGPAAARDTSRVERIRIDGSGVHVERAGAGKVVRIEAGDGDGAVVRIDESGDTSRSREVVHIGPHIRVESDGADRVRMFSDIEVAPGEDVDGDVVALFGSIDVRGRVSGNAVAVLGSVRMHPGARIDGDAVAVGGVLDQPQGAEVGGESVSIGFLQFAPGFPPFATLLLIVLIGWAVSLVAGWLLWLVFPLRMLRVAVTASRSTGGSLLLGILFPPLAVIAAVLLSVTVIGVPLALLLPVLCLVIAWAGQVAATYLLGARLLRRPLGPGSPVGPIVAGSLVVAVLFAVAALLATPQGFLRSLALFPLLLGLLITTVMGTIGSGAVLLSKFGTRPLDAADPEYAPAAVAPQAPLGPGAGEPAATATPPVV